MSLYRVSLTYEIAVVADDEMEAELEAERHVHDMDTPGDSDVNLVRTLSDLPEGWAGSIPYGDQDDGREETCAQIIERDIEERKAAEAEAERLRRQIKIPGVLDDEPRGTRD
jgi:hypothetical protein